MILKGFIFFALTSFTVHSNLFCEGEKRLQSDTGVAWDSGEIVGAIIKNI